MVGSWFRTPVILRLLADSPTGEIDSRHHEQVEMAERQAIRDQLHPLGGVQGLNWVSNGEQRKAGYTAYLPNRFSGFSKSDRVPMLFTEELVSDLKESNPAVLASLGGAAGRAFLLPKLVDRVKYMGSSSARAEAEAAAKLAKEEGAPRIFVSSASPGVATIFFPRGDVYPDHASYLADLMSEMRKEYQAILAVNGVDLQIDAPDLAMGYHLAADWGVDFFDALPQHVDAINQAITGLPHERIRVHYCYGNYLASHTSDVDFAKILQELMRLKVGVIVGETANPRHEGYVQVFKRYIMEHGWPEELKLAAGVIDVKTPFVESTRTVMTRLEQYIDAGIPPENLYAGTDCGFATFAAVNNVTYQVALQKLKVEAEAAALLSTNLGL